MLPQMQLRYCGEIANMNLEQKPPSRKDVLGRTVMQAKITKIIHFHGVGRLAALIFTEAMSKDLQPLMR